MENWRGAMDHLGRIELHRARWRGKPSLRAVYQDYFDRIKASAVSGPILEIGGGSGNLHEQLANAISCDIQWTPWLDLVADAHELPFRNGAFANVVMLDVFHHLVRPLDFLEEAMRVLRPGGRLVMIEPNVSLVSWVAFRFLHDEPILLREDPFDQKSRKTSSPYDSNQAIPFLIFVRGVERLKTLLPELQLISVERFDLWAYPLSGGFQRWSLLPLRLVRPLQKLDRHLAPRLGLLAGFRLMVVAQRGG
jgi:SAM-dependent methyltransferase